MQWRTVFAHDNQKQVKLKGYVLKTVLQPDYVSKFTCIASDCEDTCCGGWKVSIDKESYEKYQNLKHADGDITGGKITRDGIMPVEGNYAEFVLSEEKFCRFLTEKKLCHIQKSNGESYLSVTCGIFPRNYGIVNGKLERALHMSCPQAARLALLDTTPMRFSTVHMEDDQRIWKIPTLHPTDLEYPNKIYPYFEEVRVFIISLLQNQTICFEDRLLILGRFCTDLHMHNGLDSSEAQQIINEYTDAINRNCFDKLIKAPTQPAALLKVLMNLMEYRLKTGYTGKRFLECYEQFRQGLNDTNEQPEEVLCDTYLKMKSSWYDPFMQKHQYILENYFVNYAFIKLFPFGQQKSIYKEDVFKVPQTMLTEYMLLAIQYAMLKTLLVGMAGRYKDQLGTNHVMRLIQSFTKNVGSDVPYLQRLLTFFDDNKMMNLACAATLIKN